MSYNRLRIILFSWTLTTSWGLIGMEKSDAGMNASTGIDDKEFRSTSRGHLYMSSKENSGGSNIAGEIVGNLEKDNVIGQIAAVSGDDWQVMSVNVVHAHADKEKDKKIRLTITGKVGEKRTSHCVSTDQLWPLDGNERNQLFQEVKAEVQGKYNSSVTECQNKYGSIIGFAIVNTGVKWAGDKGVDAFEDFLLRNGLQQKIDTFLMCRDGGTDVQQQRKVMLVNGARVLGDSALRATMSIAVETTAYLLSSGDWYSFDQGVLNHFGHIASVELTVNGIRSNWHQVVAIAPSGIIRDAVQFTGESDALWRFAKELAVIGLLMRSKK